jgi:hypothetical protein
VPHSYQEFSPSLRLVRYVECYWSREERQGTPGDCILPDSCVDILFSTLNHEPVGLTVVGLMTVPLLCDVEAGRSFFGVRFRPGMAAAFMREAALLNDKVEPLESMGESVVRQPVVSERCVEVIGLLLCAACPCEI